MPTDTLITQNYRITMINNLLNKDKKTDGNKQV